ncbi:MAG TPA: ABC transporter ATP-binding protein [Terriglobales bacterium]|nr:ABC transporter ATP-binding protein [Terriglobales bacterium]
MRKQYGRKLALERLDLDVRRGEVFGLLGPNGAGKSTTLKLLLGLARPTSGQARLLGIRISDFSARRRVGFLPEHFHFHDWLSGPELLRLHGRLFGIPQEVLRRRIPSLLERVGLAAHGVKPLRQYSKGMQQRIGLAQALVNEPDLIFLDEPTSGLDPLGRLLVRDIIAEQRARGAAVFLNSHLLGEVEVSCDRVAFLGEGRLLATRDLRAGAVGVVRVRVRARRMPLPLWQKYQLVAGPLPPDGAPALLNVASESELPILLRALVESGAEVFEFTPESQSLEELFLNIIGRAAGEG